MLLALLAAGAGVCACSDSSPRPVATVAVVWAEGAPAGALEESPWVRAIRAGDLAYAAAVNGSDFTDPSLTSTWREDHIRWFADKAARRLDDGTAFVVLGPRPFTPLAVDVEASGDEALVVGCADKIATRPAGDVASGEWPQAFEFWLERTPEGNVRINGAAELQEPYTLATGESLTDEYCGSVAVAHGSFAPPPDPEALDELAGEDLVAPPKPTPSFAVEVPR